MKNILLDKFLAVTGTLLMAAVSLAAQEHKWAGRTLGDLESTIHDRLAALPHHGVFNTLNFDVHGDSVILSGQVVDERVKLSAERAVRQLDGVKTLVSHIEVLPASKRDDALRERVYSAIYEHQPLDKYRTRQFRSS